MTDVTTVTQVMVRGLEDQPRVSNMHCMALNSLACSLEINDPDVPSNALTPYYQEILEALFKNASREDSTDSGVNLLENSYVAFSSMVQFSGTQSNAATAQVLMPIL